MELDDDRSLSVATEMSASVPPPSPLTGCYLLAVIGEPHTQEHKEIILQRLVKGLLSWDTTEHLVDLEKELQTLVTQAPEGEDARNGERLIQFASENLVTEILIHPQMNTLMQCMRNLLSSFTRHRHLIHAGYTFAGNGSWILQDGTFSLADFTDAYQENEVQRVIRAYENSVSIDVHCSTSGGGEWANLPEMPFVKYCKIRVNPTDILDSGSQAIKDFIGYVDPYVIPASLEELLVPSDVVGNIRFSHPTLYVFPGGQGDAALFGINGFNMLVDGGFSRKACWWDFARHLDRLDAVMLTRVNNCSIAGMSSVLRRKAEASVYPHIGHFFCNLEERRGASSLEGAKDSDPLLVSLLQQGSDMMADVRLLNLKPQHCWRSPDPINLYHKVGHGTLDMYVLNPSKDSKHVRDFLKRWHSSEQKLFEGSSVTGPFNFPMPNLVSICALLIWRPANPDDNITRLMFPGSTPQHKIFEGLEKLKHLEFLQHPKCTGRQIAPTPSPVPTTVTPPIKKTTAKKSKEKSTIIEKSNEKTEIESLIRTGKDRIITDKKNEKASDIIQTEILKDETDSKNIIDNKLINELIDGEDKKIESVLKEVITSRVETKLDSSSVDSLTKKRDIKKKDKPLTEKKTKRIEKSEDNKEITMKAEAKKADAEAKAKLEPKKRVESKVKADITSTISRAKMSHRVAQKTSDKKAVTTAVEKKLTTEKSPPSTPRKIVDIKSTKEPTPPATTRIKTKIRKVSPGSTPAKSTKEANNRRVAESKIKQASPKRELTAKPAEKRDVKPKREPISRRPRPVSSPVKAVRLAKSPTKAIKSAKIDPKLKGLTRVNYEDILKDAKKSDEDNSKSMDDFKHDIDEKEEQEIVREIEAVFNRDSEAEEKLEYVGRSDIEKITCLIDDTKTDVTADGEFEEEYLIIEKEEVDQYTEESALEQQQDQEDELQKHVKDKEESEKKEDMPEVATEIKVSKDASPEIKPSESKEHSVSVEEKQDLSSEKKTSDDKSGPAKPKDIVLDSHLDEKVSSQVTVESGATTTAPTLPEDERITLDDIKEDKAIEEQAIQERPKETLPPLTLEIIPQEKKPDSTKIRDIVKTPDEVADLPLHEEVDYQTFEEKETPLEDKQETEKAIEIAEDDMFKRLPNIGFVHEIKVPKDLPLNKEMAASNVKPIEGDVIVTTFDKPSHAELVTVLTPGSAPESPMYPESKELKDSPFGKPLETVKEYDGAEYGFGFTEKLRETHITTLESPIKEVINIDDITGIPDKIPSIPEDVEKEIEEAKIFEGEKSPKIIKSVEKIVADVAEVLKSDMSLEELRACKSPLLSKSPENIVTTEADIKSFVSLDQTIPEVKVDTEKISQESDLIQKLAVKESSPARSITPEEASDGTDKTVLSDKKILDSKIEANLLGESVDTEFSAKKPDSNKGDTTDMLDKSYETNDQKVNITHESAKTLEKLEEKMTDLKKKEEIKLENETETSGTLKQKESETSTQDVVNEEEIKILPYKVKKKDEITTESESEDTVGPTQSELPPTDVVMDDIVPNIAQQEDGTKTVIIKDQLIENKLEISVEGEGVKPETPTEIDLLKESTSTIAKEDIVSGDSTIIEKPETLKEQKPSLQLDVDHESEITDLQHIRTPSPMIVVEHDVDVIKDDDLAVSSTVISSTKTDDEQDQTDHAMQESKKTDEIETISDEPTQRDTDIKPAISAVIKQEMSPSVDLDTTLQEDMKHKETLLSKDDSQKVPTPVATDVEIGVSHLSGELEDPSMSLSLTSKAISDEKEVVDFDKVHESIEKLTDESADTKSEIVVSKDISLSPKDKDLKMESRESMDKESDAQIQSKPEHEDKIKEIIDIATKKVEFTSAEASKEPSSPSLIDSPAKEVTETETSDKEKTKSFPVDDDKPSKQEKETKVLGLSTVDTAVDKDVVVSKESSRTPSPLTNVNDEKPTSEPEIISGIAKEIKISSPLTKEPPISKDSKEHSRTPSPLTMDKVDDEKERSQTEGEVISQSLISENIDGDIPTPGKMPQESVLEKTDIVKGEPLSSTQTEEKIATKSDITHDVVTVETLTKTSSELVKETESPKATTTTNVLNEIETQIVSAGSKQETTTVSVDIEKNVEDLPLIKDSDTMVADKPQEDLVKSMIEKPISLEEKHTTDEVDHSPVLAEKLLPLATVSDEEKDLNAAKLREKSPEDLKLQTMTLDETLQMSVTTKELDETVQSSVSPKPLDDIAAVLGEGERSSSIVSGTADVASRITSSKETTTHFTSSSTTGPVEKSDVELKLAEKVDILDTGDTSQLPDLTQSSEEKDSADHGDSKEISRTPSPSTKPIEIPAKTTDEEKSEVCASIDDVAKAESVKARSASISNVTSDTIESLGGTKELSTKQSPVGKEVDKNQQDEEETDLHDITTQSSTTKELLTSPGLIEHIRTPSPTITIEDFEKRSIVDDSSKVKEERSPSIASATKEASSSLHPSKESSRVPSPADEVHVELDQEKHDTPAKLSSESIETRRTPSPTIKVDDIKAGDISKVVVKEERSPSIVSDTKDAIVSLTTSKESSRVSSPADDVHVEPEKHGSPGAKSDDGKKHSIVDDIAKVKEERSHSIASGTKDAVASLTTSKESSRVPSPADEVHVELDQEKHGSPAAKIDDVEKHSIGDDIAEVKEERSPSIASGSKDSSRVPSPADDKHLELEQEKHGSVKVSSETVETRKTPSPTIKVDDVKEFSQAEDISKVEVKEERSHSIVSGTKDAVASLTTLKDSSRVPSPADDKHLELEQEKHELVKVSSEPVEISRTPSPAAKIDDVKEFQQADNIPKVEVKDEKSSPVVSDTKDAVAILTTSKESSRVPSPADEVHVELDQEKHGSPVAKIDDVKKHSIGDDIAEVKEERSPSIASDTKDADASLTTSKDSSRVPSPADDKHLELEQEKHGLVKVSSEPVEISRTPSPAAKIDDVKEFLQAGDIPKVEVKEERSASIVSSTKDAVANITTSKESSRVPSPADEVHVEEQEKRDTAAKLSSESVESRRTPSPTIKVNAVKVLSQAEDISKVEGKEERSPSIVSDTKDAIASLTTSKESSRVPSPADDVHVEVHQEKHGSPAAEIDDVEKHSIVVDTAEVKEERSPSIASDTKDAVASLTTSKESSRVPSPADDKHSELEQEKHGLVKVSSESVETRRTPSPTIKVDDVKVLSQAGDISKVEVKEERSPSTASSTKDAVASLTTSKESSRVPSPADDKHSELEQEKHGLVKVSSESVETRRTPSPTIKVDDVKVLSQAGDISKVEVKEERSPSTASSTKDAVASLTTSKESSRVPSPADDMHVELHQEKHGSPAAKIDDVKKHSINDDIAEVKEEKSHSIVSDTKDAVASLTTSKDSSRVPSPADDKHLELEQEKHELVKFSSEPVEISRTPSPAAKIDDGKEFSQAEDISKVELKEERSHSIVSDTKDAVASLTTSKESSRVPSPAVEVHVEEHEKHDTAAKLSSESVETRKTPSPKVDDVKEFLQAGDIPKVEVKEERSASIVSSTKDAVASLTTSKDSSRVQSPADEVHLEEQEIHDTAAKLSSESVESRKTPSPTIKVDDVKVLSQAEDISKVEVKEERSPSIASDTKDAVASLTTSKDSSRVQSPAVEVHVEEQEKHDSAARLSSKSVETRKTPSPTIKVDDVKELSQAGDNSKVEVKEERSASIESGTKDAVASLTTSKESSRVSSPADVEHVELEQKIHASPAKASSESVETFDIHDEPKVQSPDIKESPEDTVSSKQAIEKTGTPTPKDFDDTYKEVISPIKSTGMTDHDVDAKEARSSSIASGTSEAIETSHTFSKESHRTPSPLASAVVDIKLETGESVKDVVTKSADVHILQEQETTVIKEAVEKSTEVIAAADNIVSENVMDKSSLPVTKISVDVTKDSSSTSSPTEKVDTKIEQEIKSEDETIDSKAVSVIDLKDSTEHSKTPEDSAAIDDITKIAIKDERSLSIVSGTTDVTESSETLRAITKEDDVKPETTQKVSIESDDIKSEQEQISQQSSAVIEALDLKDELSVMNAKEHRKTPSPTVKISSAEQKTEFVGKEAAEVEEILGKEARSTSVSGSTDVITSQTTTKESCKISSDHTESEDINESKSTSIVQSTKDDALSGVDFKDSRRTSSPGAKFDADLKEEEAVGKHSTESKEITDFYEKISATKELSDLRDSPSLILKKDIDTTDVLKVTNRDNDDKVEVSVSDTTDDNVNLAVSKESSRTPSPVDKIEGDNKPEKEESFDLQGSIQHSKTPSPIVKDEADDKMEKLEKGHVTEPSSEQLTKDKIYTSSAFDATLDNKKTVMQDESHEIKDARSISVVSSTTEVIASHTTSKTSSEAPSAIAEIGAQEEEQKHVSVDETVDSLTTVTNLQEQSTIKEPQDLKDVQEDQSIHSPLVNIEADVTEKVIKDKANKIIDEKLVHDVSDSKTSEDGHLVVEKAGHDETPIPIDDAVKVITKADIISSEVTGKADVAPSLTSPAEVRETAKLPDKDNVGSEIDKKEIVEVSSTKAVDLQDNLERDEIHLTKEINLAATTETIKDESLHDTKQSTEPNILMLSTSVDSLDKTDVVLDKLSDDTNKARLLSEQKPLASVLTEIEDKSSIVEKLEEKETIAGKSEVISHSDQIGTEVLQKQDSSKYPIEVVIPDEKDVDDIESPPLTDGDEKELESAKITDKSMTSELHSQEKIHDGLLESKTADESQIEIKLKPDDALFKPVNTVEEAKTSHQPDVEATKEPITDTPRFETDKETDQKSDLNTLETTETTQSVSAKDEHILESTESLSVLTKEIETSKTATTSESETAVKTIAKSIETVSDTQSKVKDDYANAEKGSSALEEITTKTKLLKEAEFIPVADSQIPITVYVDDKHFDDNYEQKEQYDLNTDDKQAGVGKSTSETSKVDSLDSKEGYESDPELIQDDVSPIDIKDSGKFEIRSMKINTASKEKDFQQAEHLYQKLSAEPCLTQETLYSIEQPSVETANMSTHKLEDSPVQSELKSAISREDTKHEALTLDDEPLGSDTEYIAEKDVYSEKSESLRVKHAQEIDDVTEKTITKTEKPANGHVPVETVSEICHQIEHVLDKPKVEDAFDVKQEVLTEQSTCSETKSSPLVRADKHETEKANVDITSGSTLTKDNIITKDKSANGDVIHDDLPQQDSMTMSFISMKSDLDDHDSTNMQEHDFDNTTKDLVSDIHSISLQQSRKTSAAGSDIIPDSSLTFENTLQEAPESLQTLASSTEEISKETSCEEKYSFERSEKDHKEVVKTHEMEIKSALEGEYDNNIRTKIAHTESGSPKEVSLSMTTDSGIMSLQTDTKLDPHKHSDDYVKSMKDNATNIMESVSKAFGEDSVQQGIKTESVDSLLVRSEFERVSTPPTVPVSPLPKTPSSIHDIGDCDRIQGEITYDKSDGSEETVTKVVHVGEDVLTQKISTSTEKGVKPIKSSDFESDSELTSLMHSMGKIKTETDTVTKIIKEGENVVTQTITTVTTKEIISRDDGTPQNVKTTIETTTLSKGADGATTTVKDTQTLLSECSSSLKSTSELDMYAKDIKLDKEYLDITDEKSESLGSQISEKELSIKSDMSSPKLKDEKFLPSHSEFITTVDDDSDDNIEDTTIDTDVSKKIIREGGLDVVETIITTTKKETLKLDEFTKILRTTTETNITKERSDGSKDTKKNVDVKTEEISSDRPQPTATELTSVTVKSLDDTDTKSLSGFIQTSGSSIAGPSTAVGYPKVETTTSSESETEEKNPSVEEFLDGFYSVEDKKVDVDVKENTVLVDGQEITENITIVTTKEILVSEDGSKKKMKTTIETETERCLPNEQRDVTKDVKISVADYDVEIVGGKLDGFDSIGIPDEQTTSHTEEVFEKGVLIKRKTTITTIRQEFENLVSKIRKIKTIVRTVIEDEHPDGSVLTRRSEKTSVADVFLSTPVNDTNESAIPDAYTDSAEIVEDTSENTDVKNETVKDGMQTIKRTITTKTKRETLASSDETVKRIRTTIETTTVDVYPDGATETTKDVKVTVSEMQTTSDNELQSALKGLISTGKIENATRDNTKTIFVNGDEITQTITTNVSKEEFKCIDTHETAIKTVTETITENAKKDGSVETTKDVQTKITYVPFGTDLDDLAEEHLEQLEQAPASMQFPELPAYPIVEPIAETSMKRYSVGEITTDTETFQNIITENGVDLAQTVTVVTSKEILSPDQVKTTIETTTVKQGSDGLVRKSKATTTTISDIEDTLDTEMYSGDYRSSSAASDNFKRRRIIKLPSLDSLVNALEAHSAHTWGTECSGLDYSGLDFSGLDSSDEDGPGSPSSTKSQIAHSPRSDLSFEMEPLKSLRESAFYQDPMSASFYGQLPQEEVSSPHDVKIEKTITKATHEFLTQEKLRAVESFTEETTDASFLKEADDHFDKAIEEHKKVSGTEVISNITAKYDLDLVQSTSHQESTSESNTLKLQEIPIDSKKATESSVTSTSSQETKVEESKPKVEQSETTTVTSPKDPIESWGKPLGLPSPIMPPTDGKSTPKKQNPMLNKNKINQDKIKEARKSQSPSKSPSKHKPDPVYLELTYVPHHGNSYYSAVEFFKRVRARYYVFSGTEPSKEIYNALLDAKKTWEDKELEVTIIPTYDTDVLGYWVTENEEALERYKIDLSPSASRCTINLQDHETSCAAYRLEF